MCHTQASKIADIEEATSREVQEKMMDVVYAEAKGYLAFFYRLFLTSFGSGFVTLFCTTE